MSLESLAAEVARDLARLNFPPPAWTIPTEGILDALVVGGGMCGQTVAFALRREGIHAIRVIDRAPRGREGPWDTFARMPTLRSPKHLTGPDLGVPSLTYRAWHEAKFGRAAWDTLYKIDRLDWRDYLLWVRDTVGIAVENDTELVDLTLEPALVRARLRDRAGMSEVRARRVVLALGREGSGAARWPRFANWSPASRGVHTCIHHAAEAIDFSTLAGARVALLGAGATAFDNAGTALEAGAREVVMFARRQALPQINKSKWASFPGFQRGFAALDDAHRWAFLTYIFAEQVPPPFESVQRCERHSGFSIRFGAEWEDLAEHADRVTVTVRGLHEQFDTAIIATGFDVDLTDRPEIAGFRDRIALWRDHVPPEQAARHPEAARFPYLGAGFELIGENLGRIHVFNWGSTMSHGQLAGDIPGLETGAKRLAEAIARALFIEDADRHYELMRTFDDHELAPTGYYVRR